MILGSKMGVLGRRALLNARISHLRLESQAQREELVRACALHASTLRGRNHPGLSGLRALIPIGLACGVMLARCKSRTHHTATYRLLARALALIGLAWRARLLWRSVRRCLAIWSVSAKRSVRD